MLMVAKGLHIKRTMIKQGIESIAQTNVSRNSFFKSSLQELETSCFDSSKPQPVWCHFSQDGGVSRRMEI